MLSLPFTISYRGLGVPAAAAGILAVRGPGLIGAADYDGAALVSLVVLAVLALLRAKQKEGKSS